jgi:hypothetical protein
VTPEIRPLDEETLLRMIRYSLRTGADRLWLRPGYLPMVDGLGGPRELRYRQLTGEDTAAAAATVLGRLWAPVAPGDAGEPVEGLLEPIAFLDAGGEEALVEVRFEPCRGGIAVALDLVRPLPEEEAVRLLEP